VVVCVYVYVFAFVCVLSHDNGGMEWTESVETPGNPQKETNSYPWFLVMRSFSLALAGVLCAFSYVSATQGGLSLELRQGNGVGLVSFWIRARV
jgi:hypothetical protein